MKTALVWLRRDFRLGDNRALYEAAKTHDRVVPIYIHAPDEEGAGAPGAASKLWLHQSLNALNQSLENNNCSLIVASGESLAVLRLWIEKTKAQSVFWNRVYEPDMIARDEAVELGLDDDGVAVKSFAGSTIVEPAAALKQDGTPYKVFTPFWKKLGRPALEDMAAPLPIPPLSPHGFDGERLEALNLAPDHPWARKFDGLWQPGENGAANRLADFIEDGLARYKGERDFPAHPSTSRLSPHLHFGEITPGQIVHAVRTVRELAANEEKFFSEIGWRDFAHALLYHFPHTVTEPLNPRFEGFPWQSGDKAREVLERWQRGETGFSLIDAGMQELWQTGTMHNRVRMITASFLVKNLGIHWREGAAWFWDCLFDADLANNTLGWQWVAGSGADAAPFFRIFNPETQAEKFDPNGEYRKAYLGSNWLTRDIKPLVDLKKSREAALAAYDQVKD